MLTSVIGAKDKIRCCLSNKIKIHRSILPVHLTTSAISFYSCTNISHVPISPAGQFSIGDLKHLMIAETACNFASIAKNAKSESFANQMFDEPNPNSFV